MKSVTHLLDEYTERPSKYNQVESCDVCFTSDESRW